MMMSRFKHQISLRKLLSALANLLVIVCFGQETDLITGQIDRPRVITTAVPFLSISPDARSSALGFSGVATSPDMNSVHWNNGKMSFVDSQWGVSFSYMPWLNQLTNDMYVGYLSGQWKKGEIHAFGASLRYFDRGDFDVLDNQSNIIGDFSPNELAFDVTYSRKLSDKLGVGLTLRYILSNINDVTNPDQRGKAEDAIATDLGIYYDMSPLTRGFEIAFGAHISNFGPKIDYLGEDYFLPVNLRLGTAIEKDLDLQNTVSFSLDLNKLLVPTPPVVRRDPESGSFEVVRGKDPDRSLLGGTFGSFFDAPSGFSEEFKEIAYAIGFEYDYRELAFLRLGYFGEHIEKGDRKIITAGVGFSYKDYGIDLSYLIPLRQNHPLSETLQVSIRAGFSNDNE